MKRFFITLAAVAAIALSTLGRPMAALAQAKTGVVVSISSFDKLTSEVTYLAGLAGQEGQVAFPIGMARGVLMGVDPAKPWGMILLAEDHNPVPIIFLPAADCKALITTLKEPLHLEVTEQAGGVFLVKANGKNAYVKSAGGWTFIAESEENLKKAPAEPDKVLDGLDKTFDIAIRVFVKNFSEADRAQFIGMMTSQLQAVTMRPQPGEDAEQAAMRKKTMQAGIKAIEKAANETEQMTFGWMTDTKSEKKKMVFDFNLIATAGTDTAKQLADMQTAKSMFSGFFMPDAGFSFQGTTKLNADAIEQYSTMLTGWSAKAQKQIDDSADFPTDDARKQAKVAVDELSKAALDTVKAGQLDAGVATMFGPGSLNAVAGAQVASGPAFESGVKKLVDLIKGEINAELKALPAYKNISMHTISVPVSDPKAASVLGDKMDIYFGFAPKSVYLALGKQGKESLEKCVDASEAGSTKVGAPTQMVVAVKPLFDFANSVEANPIVGMITGKLAESKSADHIWLRVSPTANGVSEQLEIEEGVLKAIGAAAAMGANGGAQPGVNP